MTDNTERADFEAWVAEHFAPRPVLYLRSMDASVAAWEAWQARAALPVREGVSDEREAALRTAGAAGLAGDAELMDAPPCPVCGGTERSRAGYLLCECPAASLKPADGVAPTTEPDRCPSCGIGYGYHLAACAALAPAQIDAATLKAGEPMDFQAWIASRRCANPRCESWGCAKHDACGVVGTPAVSEARMLELWHEAEDAERGDGCEMVLRFGRSLLKEATAGVMGRVSRCVYPECDCEKPNIEQGCRRAPKDGVRGPLGDRQEWTDPEKEPRFQPGEET